VRRQAPSVLARLALTAALLAVGHPALAQLPSQLPPLPEHHLESRLLTLTNEARAGAGVAPVGYSAVLAQAARHHAEEMVRLGYFSHVSPTPGRGSPEERVRLVGGTHARLGENLAEVGARSLDVGDRIVDGWMASPGHRTTLLHTAWTHVGFGVSEDANGRAYVAQVFAADPNPIRAVDVTRSNERTLALRFDVAIASAGMILMVTNEAGAAPVPAPAGGTQTLVVDAVPADARTHVRLGWAPDEASSYIAQQSGWFDPATRSWTEDWSSAERHAEVVDYAASEPVQGVMLRLAFERDPRDLIVLVDGAELTTTASGTSLEARLSGREGVREVIVGAPQPDGRVLVLHAFEVEVRRDGARLR
jgi:uncharacterized protein YkwD